MQAKFLSLKKITAKNGKKYTILEASDGLRSREFFVTLPDDTIEYLSSLEEGSDIEIEFDANPFGSDRISVKDVREV